MPTKNNPGAWDRYATLHPDQPYFCLAGGSEDEAEALEHLARLRVARIHKKERPLSDVDVVVLLLGLAAEMRAWKAQDGNATDAVDTSYMSTGTRS